MLFDNFEQERTARGRARVPSDLAVDRVLLDKKNKEDEKSQLTGLEEAASSLISDTGTVTKFTKDRAEEINKIKCWGFDYKTVGFTWIKKNKKALALGLFF